MKPETPSIISVTDTCREFNAVGLLVDIDGHILGGNLPDTVAVSSHPVAFEDVISPADRSVDFEIWWHRLIRGASDPGSFELGIFQRADSEPCPVSVNAAAVAGRDEFLITCVSLNQRRLSLLNAIHSVGVAITRLDLASVLRTVREKITEFMPVDGFYVAFYDRETDCIDLREVVDNGEFKGDSLTQLPRDGLVGWVLNQRMSLNVHDTEVEQLPVEPRTVGQMPRSIMMVPLIAQGDIVGVVSVQHYAPNVYSDDEAWLLDAIAGQMAVAIRNAQLYEQTASRLATLASLQSTALRLAASFEKENIAEVIGQAVIELLSPDEVRVYLRDAPEGQLRFATGMTIDGHTPPREDPLPDSMINMTDEHGAAFILNEVKEHSNVASDFDWVPGAVAGYPIRRADNRYGVMLLLYREQRFFRQDERRILSLMTNQAAVAIENMQYHANLVLRFEEVAALYTLAQQITGQRDSTEILNLVVSTLREIFSCRACVIALREGDSEEITLRAAVGVKDFWRRNARFKVGEGIAGRVAQTGKSIYVPDVYEDTQSVIFDPEVRSVLAVPIAYKDRVLGSLNLDSVVVNAFSPDHERILTIAAAQVAAALENAGLYRDLSERAVKLETVNKELENLEHLREELIQNLSHELRTPLTYVKGYVALLHDGGMGELNEEQLEALQIVSDKSDAIERMITDVVMLEEITPDTLEREIFDVNKLAAQAIDTTRLIQSGKTLTFKQDLVPGACWVYGDRSRLMQAIDNLLVNAIKFTPEGGTVALQTSLHEDGELFEIRISDSGIGIAPEHLTRIFDRFYQVRDPASQNARGSGIGLAIVKRVVEAHGGRVLVKSERGKGSTFTLVLKVVEPPDESFE